MDIKERDDFAIKFADWLNNLNPADKVSVWSKSGEFKGLFSMDNEQLLDEFKRQLLNER